MPAGRSKIVRATALVLATGVNVLFLLLLSSHRRTAIPEPLVPAMIWIATLEQPRSSPKHSGPRRAAREEAPSAKVASVPSLVPAPPVVASQTEPGQGAAIAVPSIDWNAAASKAAEAVVRSEELAKRRSSLNSEPKVASVRPKQRDYENGRVEHFEGGVVMWFDGTCAYTSDPQVMQPWALDPVGKFFGVRPTKACESRNLSRERADALEAATKPRFLGGTRPLPDEPATSIKIP